MQTENQTPPLLTLDVLASMKIEDGRGHACPNVLIYDPYTQTNIECKVWVYPPKVYSEDDAFIFTDILSDDATYQRLVEAAIRNRSKEPEYSRYHRHLRVGLSPHEGAAVISRAKIEQILQTKQYTVS